LPAITHVLVEIPGALYRRERTGAMKRCRSKVWSAGIA